MRRGLARWSAFTCVGIGIGACAKVIGLDGTYTDVVHDFCKCDAAETWFVEPCETHVQNALAGADASVASQWLTSYTSLECNDCEKAESCIGIAPLCLARGAGCDVPEACCGSSSRTASCVDHTCQACRSQGDSCSATSDCCAETDVYCAPADSPMNAGTCVKRAPNCLPSQISPCDTVDDCCGSEIGKARCESPKAGVEKRCFQSCDYTDADNCEGCCATTVESSTMTISGLCIDQGFLKDDGSFQPNAEICPQLCDFTGGPQCAPHEACLCPQLTDDPGHCLKKCVPLL